MSEHTPRRIIIGDVHGHYDGLMLLFEAISPNCDDRIYFLGDLIDRGSQSAQVIKFVRDNGYCSLLGNHEQLLLEAFWDGEVNRSALNAWLYSGGQATVSSYKDAASLLDDVDWMRTLPLYQDLGDLWLVHAGVHPLLPIDEQGAEDFCWIRGPFHCIESPYFPDKTIVVGHTITFTFPGVTPGQIARGHGWMDIDTGAYNPKSGWLTAYDATYQTAYQVHVFEKRVRRLPLEDIVKDVELTKLLAQ
jgi:serine/threonine protein phosphatase 1